MKDNRPAARLFSERNNVETPAPRVSDPTIGQDRVVGDLALGQGFTPRIAQVLAASCRDRKTT